MRILSVLLLIAAVLAALNFYRGPRLFGEYAEHVMMGTLALNFGLLFLNMKAPASASEAAEVQMRTREWVRRKPLKTAVTIAFVLVVPFAIAWIKNDFDWWILAVVELVASGIMLDMWYRDKPITRKG